MNAYYTWLLKAYISHLEEYEATSVNGNNYRKIKLFQRWSGKFRTEIKRIELLLPK